MITFMKEIYHSKGEEFNLPAPHDYKYKVHYCGTITEQYAVSNH